MSNLITIAYADRYFDWPGSAASPIRAKRAVDRICAFARDRAIPMTILTPTLDGEAVGAELARVHDAAYIAHVHAAMTEVVESVA